MAQKVQLVLTCDLHEQETPAVETASFGYDGSTYAFELCQEHLDQFNDAMHRYIDAARKAEPKAQGRERRSGSGQSRDERVKPARGTRAAELAEIREWARANGWQVSDRGRIPERVLEAFSAAKGQ